VSAADLRTPFETIPTSPWIRFDAETVLSQARTPPADDAAWEPIVLPDSWRTNKRYLQGISAWYRFRMADTPPDEPYALYLWRFSMNAEAYFNDELIGSGGSFDEPIARNWNRPLLFPLPLAAWRETDNWVYVHLRVYPGWGTFTPPAIGPTALLQPAYDSRFFWQITLAQYALVITIAVMVLCFVFWVSDRRDTTYLFLALASAAWSVYSLNLFVQHIPMSAKIWWWLVHTMIDSFTLCLVCFAHRLLHVSRPWVERTIVAAVLISTSLYALWDLPQLARYNNIVHTAMAAFACYLLVWLVRTAARDRTPDAIVFSGCFALLFALGVHDIFLNSLAIPELWATRFFLLQFGAPAMLLVMGVHLARRLSAAVGETRAANVHLEARVEEVTRTLEETFSTQRDLERRQAAAEERDRIYQDLHDDVGARLLSLVYAAGEGKSADMAREALREIRSIVSSDRIDGGFVRDVAADWRVEIEGRCESAGFAVDWESTIDGAARLSGLQRYHLDRVMRELISNSLEHSGGTAIRVRINCSGAHLHIHYADNGRGFERTGASGRGVVGVDQRVARLGGTLAWHTSAGAHCELNVPLPQMEGGVQPTPGLS
jgi:signal transduction histidine kinase